MVSRNDFLILEHTKRVSYNDNNDSPPETEAEAEIFKQGQGQRQQRHQLRGRGENVVSQHEPNNNNFSKEQLKATLYRLLATLVGAGMTNWLYEGDGTTYANYVSNSVKIVDLADFVIVDSSARTRMTIVDDTDTRLNIMQTIANHLSVPTHRLSVDTDQKLLFDHKGIVWSLLLQQREHSAGGSEGHAKRGED